MRSLFTFHWDFNHFRVLMHCSSTESRVPRKSQEKEDIDELESYDDVKRTAQMSRDRLLRTSGKIMGKQA